MVSLVLVSHSQKLAESVAEVALLMAGSAKIKAIGGNDDGGYGASEKKITAAVEEMYSDDGVIVIADIGSSVNTAKAVIKKMADEGKRVYLADCPMIEGSIAAAVISSINMPLEEVLRQTQDSKNMKKA
ncbi:MAG: hypothetical protein MR424_07980 [Treponema sp.]|nr:hypothetical protein [Treponema sp.]